SRREGIVEGKWGRTGLTTKAEISVVHGRGGNGSAHRVSACVLEVTFESGKPKCTVAAVVFGYDHRSIEQEGRLVIAERVRARQLLQVVAVDHRLIDVAIFSGAVEVICARAEHDRELTSTRVADLRGRTGGVKLDLLESVLRRRDLSIGA